MRTTLTLDDAIARELKRRALESGNSFKTVVNETLLAGLSQPRQRTPHRLPTFSLGGPLPGVDLNKALALAGELEDAERVRKLTRGSAPLEADPLYGAEAVGSSTDGRVAADHDAV